MWLRSSSIPLDEHGSKIRKVIRCRPTVSNEIILVGRNFSIQEYWAPVKSIIDIVLLHF